MSWPDVDHALHVLEVEGRHMADGLTGADLEAATRRTLALEARLAAEMGQGERGERRDGAQQGLFRR